MKNDDTIRVELSEIHDETIGRACELLRSYAYEIQEYLASFVASICELTVKEMFEECSKYNKSNYRSQARWLFWYAYRYMTNESYDRIALMTKQHYRHSITPSGIGMSINKMARLVEMDATWMKRWIVVRRVIKIYQETNIPFNSRKNEPQKVKVLIVHPKSVDMKVEFKCEQE